MNELRDLLLVTENLEPEEVTRFGELMQTLDDNCLDIVKMSLDSGLIEQGTMVMIGTSRKGKSLYQAIMHDEITGEVVLKAMNKTPDRKDREQVALKRHELLKLIDDPMETEGSIKRGRP